MSCQQQGCDQAGQDRTYEREGPNGPFICKAGKWCDDHWAMITKLLEIRIKTFEGLQEAGVSKTGALQAVDKLFEEPSS